MALIKDITDPNTYAVFGYHRIGRIISDFGSSGVVQIELYSYVSPAARAAGLKQNVLFPMIELQAGAIIETPDRAQVYAKIVELAETGDEHSFFAPLAGAVNDEEDED